MHTKFLSLFSAAFLIAALHLFPLKTAMAGVKGIYISQSTAENTPYLSYLIQQAKETGIDTFVVDMHRMSQKYRNNIALLHNNGIHYVARVVVFNDGGDDSLIRSVAHWEKRYALVKQALDLGAKEIQLDYIRYNTRQGSSPAHAHNVHEVIKWFKDRVHAQNALLQIDVFGISSFGEESHIGQNVKLFANSVDAICPMNYPSHFEPYRQHAVTPYETTYKALTALRAQVDNNPSFKLYNYIELFNYRYPLTHEQRLNYIQKQIQGTEDAKADGWYAWSASNKYEPLFTVLKMQKTRLVQNNSPS